MPMTTASARFFRRTVQRMERSNETTDLESCGELLARFIALSANQIRSAYDDARTDTEALCAAVLTMASELDRVETEALAAASGTALKHLQFIDRLQQRLANVAANLDRAAQHVRADDAVESSPAWSALIEAARASFTMESERAAFDSIFPPQSTAGNGTDAAAAGEERS